VTSVGEPDRYASAWRQLITRRCWFVGLFLAFAPVIVLVTIALDRSSSEAAAKRAPLEVGLLMFALLVVAGFRIGAVKCPRCGKPFTSLGWMQRSFTSRCLHCKLPEGSVGPSASTDR
jgi:hypothetical protein